MRVGRALLVVLDGDSPTRRCGTSASSTWSTTARAWRVDGLVGELLAMTQRVEPKPVCVELSAFLTDQVARHKEIAAAKSLAVSVRSADGTVMIDPVVICRVLDNLMTNAIRHAPESGAVGSALSTRPSVS